MSGWATRSSMRDDVQLLLFINHYLLLRGTHVHHDFKKPTFWNRSLESFRQLHLHLHLHPHPS